MRPWHFHWHNLLLLNPDVPINVRLEVKPCTQSKALEFLHFIRNDSNEKNVNLELTVCSFLQLLPPLHSIWIIFFVASSCTSVFQFGLALLQVKQVLILLWRQLAQGPLPSRILNEDSGGVCCEIFIIIKHEDGLSYALSYISHSASRCIFEQAHR